MRKYGSMKQNPNPKWPCQQMAVVVPPGSNSTAIGRNQKDSINVFTPTLIDSKSEYIHSRVEGNPIMDYTNFEKTEIIFDKELSINSYISKQKGSYVKIEFLFGENTHIEKNGTLENVGKDFLIISESQTGIRTICPLKNIKFINIYSRNNT